MLRCEGSKYLFFLRFEAGPLYKPSTRDFSLVLKEIIPADAERLRSIWNYWESEDREEVETEDGLHPDHFIPH